MIFDIVDLKQVPNDIYLFGGKAVVLSQLIHGGLNVPSGFVLSSSIYRQYIDGSFDRNDLQNELFNWLNKIGIKQECIVRSSANVENIIGKDCPGIFESYVCHDKKDILDLIIKVWDSTTSISAQSFFSKENFQENISMAVIVQCIQKGKYNAVIQSYDFVEDRKRIIVEYCQGSINSIVDDEQDAFIYYIEYNNTETTYLESLPIDKIKEDCITIESIVGGNAEIEAQISDNEIWYIQARNIN